LPAAAPATRPLIVSEFHDADSALHTMIGCVAACRASILKPLIRHFDTFASMLRH